MSTRDARLSPQERAALANLEAAAVAADPQFAARLRGSPLFRLRAVAPRLLAFTVGHWRGVLRQAWWGAPVSVVGFLLMWIGLWTAAWVSVIGAVAATLGFRLLAQTGADWLDRRRHEPAEV